MLFVYGTYVHSGAGTCVQPSEDNLWGVSCLLLWSKSLEVSVLEAGFFSCKVILLAQVRPMKKSFMYMLFCLCVFLYPPKLREGTGLISLNWSYRQSLVTIGMLGIERSLSTLRSFECMYINIPYTSPDFTGSSISTVTLYLFFIFEYQVEHSLCLPTS